MIAGPTASGKTALAVDLALALGGEVVSADSMQLYAGMDIATAKPTARETRGVPHHLVGFVGANGRFSVAQYAPLAHAAIQDIDTRGKVPILCGGAGLYIQAVTENLQFAEGALRHDGTGTWRELQRTDPAAAAKIHPNDQKRISHALALYRATGVTLTEQNLRSRRSPSPCDARMLLLNARERQHLYDRIDQRVDQMLAAGLEEEARLWRQNESATAAQAIGYKELEPYFQGRCTLEAAVENLKRETRRYAKRQLSWFRRMAREWNERLPGSCVELFIEDENLLEHATAFARRAS
ncbi:MAG: tRNA (adenosine(37)-N6)-dimethylallyltransferase MiaA [Oscillospiraceae bacterium]|nr:tRNA (adenosine(37)-N6)-dimethylallyltransferase MiaA [Oscillospiraceae bacterium]